MNNLLLIKIIIGIIGAVSSYWSIGLCVEAVKDERNNAVLGGVFLSLSSLLIFTFAFYI